MENWCLTFQGMLEEGVKDFFESGKQVEIDELKVFI